MRVQVPSPLPLTRGNMTGNTPRNDNKSHGLPMGLTQRDKIEEYYRKFIEIWQTSESLDEAHHRILSELDPSLTYRRAMTSRAVFLKSFGVTLKELPSYIIDWESLAKYANSFAEESK
jgi:hypothetical protein